MSQIKPQDVISVQEMFPDQVINAQDFWIIHERFFQNNWNGADSKSENRIEFLIPQRAALLKNFWIDCKVELLTDAPWTLKAGSFALHWIPHSLPELIDWI